MVTAFLIYVIRWAVVLTLLYSLYGLFMKRETLHGVNRLVLLLVLAASMVLPLCQIETREANIVMEGRELLEQQIATVSTIDFEPSVQAEDAPEPRPDLNIAILTVIVVYLIGVVIAWSRYLWSLASLLLLIRRSKRIEVPGLPKNVKVLTHPDIKTPCSWMNWMLLSPADVQIRPIVLHEWSHIRLHHSWDMLLCELTCRMLWCVPFAWMLRQDLRDVHEYQADRRVLQSGIKDEEYQLLLIRKATDTGLQPVVNALNQSPIKRRFKMMYKKPSRRWVALKAAYLLPLGALSLVAFARPQTLTEIEEKVGEEVTHYAAIMSPLVSPDDAVPPVETAETQSLPTDPDDWKVVVNAPGAADANLLNADLKDNPEATATASQMTSEYGATVLDSVMQAVGARKIANGTYIGHFQPSLNNDTVRLARVEFLDKESHKTLEQTFPQNANDPYAYRMTLQAGTRKDETGHYIRYLTPVKATVREYDQPKYDPNLILQPANLLELSIFTPAAIEQTKQETRVFMCVATRHPLGADPRQERMPFADVAIHDADTNDKYMFRSMDEAYLKLIQRIVEDEDTAYAYQVCLVFPPLGKKVKRIWIGDTEANEVGETFRLSDIPRKGKTITH